MRSQLHASRLRTSSVTNVGLRRVMMCLTRTTCCGCRALALILLVPIPLLHRLLKHRLQLQMMPLSHFAKLATVGIQERACGLPATGVRYVITASVLKYRSRKPSPRPTHALLAPRHAIYHLHNLVNAHSLAFSMHDRRPSFYPCPNIYDFQYSRRCSVAEKRTSSKVRPWAGREYA